MGIYTLAVINFKFCINVSKPVFTRNIFVKLTWKKTKRSLDHEI